MLHGGAMSAGVLECQSAGPAGVRSAGEPGVASMDIPLKFHYFEVTKMTI